MRKRWRGGLALLLAVLAGCTVPYEPLRVASPSSLPEDAFDRCRNVLVARFGGVEHCDRQSFAMRTVWAPMPDLQVPGQQRAVVFEERGEICILVQARYLSTSLFGPPSWSSPRPAAHLERQLGALLEAALEQPDFEVVAEPPPQ